MVVAFLEQYWIHGLVYYGAGLLALSAAIWLLRFKIHLWQFLLLGIVGLPLVLAGSIIALLMLGAHLIWEARKVLMVSVGRE